MLKKGKTWCLYVGLSVSLVHSWKVMKEREREKNEEEEEEQGTMRAERKLIHAIMIQVQRQPPKGEGWCCCASLFRLSIPFEFLFSSTSSWNRRHLPVSQFNSLSHFNLDFDLISIEFPCQIFQCGTNCCFRVIFLFLGNF